MKIGNKHKWMLIVYSVLLIALGITTFILAIVNLGAVVRTTSYVIAVALFIIGLMHIVTSLVANTQDFFTAELVVGSFAIAIGVVLCVFPDLIGGFLPILLATLFFAFAAIGIAKAIVAIKFKYKVSWIIAYIAAAVVGITLGILSLVFRYESTQVMYGSVGAVVLILGVIELIYSIKFLNNKQEETKPFEE